MNWRSVGGFALSFGASGALIAALSFSPVGCSSSGFQDGGTPDGSPAQDSGGGDSHVIAPDGGGSDTGSTHEGGMDAGTDAKGDACNMSAPVTGSVTNTGGSVSRLVFAVVGDTRPANEDDTGGYPTSIITKIYQDIQALSPQPQLVIGTGDYQFSSTGSYATASEQVSMYMMTRQSYTGPFFPAMGNHECGVSGGFTTSDNNNCGPGNQGGSTPNYNAFMSQMMTPIGQTNPYYSINVTATDGSWTAKFVVTAANSWDSAQQSWLATTLAQKTTYTFVVRHEPSDAYPPLPPGVAGVDALLATNPYTLLITGHSHTYGHYSDTPKVVVIGNGGAPLSSKDYGYGLFTQRCDGAIVGDEIDYMSGATDSEFHFVITADGTITH